MKSRIATPKKRTPAQLQQFGENVAGILDDNEKDIAKKAAEKKEYERGADRARAYIASLKGAESTALTEIIEEVCDEGEAARDGFAESLHRLICARPDADALDLARIWLNGLNVAVSGLLAIAGESVVEKRDIAPMLEMIQQLRAALDEVAGGAAAGRPS